MKDTMFLEQDREEHYEPAENQIYPFISEQWFKDRIGKEVFRTSRIQRNLCYKLQMMKHVPYWEKEKWRLFRGKKFLKKLKGCGYWEIEKHEDNMPSCLKDCEKQYLSQTKWGFRFFDNKPSELELEKFKI